LFIFPFEVFCLDELQANGLRELTAYAVVAQPTVASFGLLPPIGGS
jgi:hypothetical protein